jgi:hypothetical protein
MKTPILAVFLLGCWGASPANGQALPLPEIVSVPKSAPLAARLSALGLDLLADWDGRLYIVAPPRDICLLESLGISFRYETWSFAPAVPRLATQGGPIGAYHTGLSLERDLLDLQTKYPGLAKVFDLGMSLEKRPLYALKISDNVSLDEDEAETLFLGCHHAREWISVEVPFLLGKYLLERQATDPAIKQLVDQSEVWIVPLVNPDGHDYSVRVYRYWRKNRRDNGGGNYGVDLNRNYGYMWGVDNQGSSGNPASDVYRGTAAFSEPETRAIRNLFLQRNFRAVVSYHSYSQVILYPWGYTKTPSSLNQTLGDLAVKMSDLIRNVAGRSYTPGQGGSLLYLTNGDTTDWTFGTAGIPSFTIELPPIDELGGGFFNGEKDIEPIFLENLEAQLFLLRWAVDDYAARPREPDFGLRDLVRPILSRPKR